jgi:hypothetical protein
VHDALERIAEHHVACDEGLGEPCIRFVAYPHPGESTGERFVPCRRRPELIEELQRRRPLRLRELHVEGDDACPVAVEQRIHEGRQPGSRPGPLPLAREARFVDVHDDDAPIDAARHGEPQAHVVEITLDATEHLARGITQGCGQQQQKGNGDEAGAGHRPAPWDAWRGTPVGHGAN